MSLQITPQINGQVASSTLSYCYLQEPLKVHITDSDEDVRAIYADIVRIATDTGEVVSTHLKYIHRDVSSLGGVVVDLSKVMRQMHNYDTYRYGSVLDIVNGWDSVVSKYIYRFEFYTDEDSLNKTNILKLPIIGGRSFDTFTPSVTYQTPIQELSTSYLQGGRLGGYQIPTFTLKQISSVTDDDYSPTAIATSITANSSNIPCEGVLYWKSKLGGWMSWGMDLKTETKSHQTAGRLDVGMFESTAWSGGGNIYSQPNYISTSSRLSISIKSLTLTKDELLAVSEIAGSPAVYYRRKEDVPSSSDRIELMRMTSASAPIKTHIGGGDFSVSLLRMSSTENKIK